MHLYCHGCCLLCKIRSHDTHVENSQFLDALVLRQSKLFWMALTDFRDKTGIFVFRYFATSLIPSHPAPKTKQRVTADFCVQCLKPLWNGMHRRPHLTESVLTIRDSLQNSVSAIKWVTASTILHFSTFNRISNFVFSFPKPMTMWVMKITVTYATNGITR